MQAFEIEDFIVMEDDLLCREGLCTCSQIKRLRTARDLQEETEFDFEDINFDFMCEVNSKVKACNEKGDYD